MTLFDILNLNREFLARLRNAGGRIDDIDYLDLFADFNDMVASGNKVSYAVSVLANRYCISPRSIYAIIKRFKSYCNFNSR